jgi:hypothetical protein
MKNIRLILATACLLVLAGSINAQTTPRVKARQEKQQARIIKGEQNGSLTPKETAKLEAQQAKIQHDKKAAKADGVVTPAERRKLNREQNRANRNIYKQKHDAQKQ